MAEEKQIGLSIEQANRLREDLKRSAHAHAIIEARIRQLGIKDIILEKSILLSREENDALFRDMEGMLNGNGGSRI